MEQTHSRARLELRLIATAVMIASMPLCAALVSARDAPAGGYTDPAAIDRAVEQFTGIPTGQIGGARQAADPRLRLAHCPAPLTLDWYGQNRSSVSVRCEGPQPWRIFVQTRPAPASAPAAPVIERGDPVTVLVRGRGFSVQQSGEAMEKGHVGDWIAIRMASGSNRDATPVRARVERPGLAVID